MGLRVQPQKPPLQALLAKCGFMQGAFDKIYQNNDKKMSQNKGSSIFEFKIKSKKWKVSELQFIVH